jgi:hypothetical protein
MSPRAAAWLAWSICGLSLVLTTLSLLLLIMNLSRANAHVFDYWVESTLIAVVFSSVGAVIASYRPENLIGWMFCAVGLLPSIRHFASQYAIYALLAAPGSLPVGEVLAWFAAWLWVPHTGLTALLILLFPDGRLPSARWRWLAWFTGTMILVGTVLTMFAIVPLSGLGSIQNPLGIEGTQFIPLLVEAALWTFALIAIASVFVRMRRGVGAERQQIKWVAHAGAITCVGVFLRYLVFMVTSASWAWWLGTGILTLGIIGTPIAMAIAILRYRLYDIDVVINRTLVYGSLTAMLVAVYYGSVVVLQYIFRALSGGESQLAIVASTLAIAALFNPLRRRVQALVDRRFYRGKYDAAKTLAAFNARLRDETDLDTLGRDLMGVVRDTIQPEHVSLWLRSDTAPRSQQTD